MLAYDDGFSAQQPDRLAAFGPDADVRWEMEDELIRGKPVVTNGGLVQGSANRLFRFDLETRETDWEIPFDRGFEGAPAVQIAGTMAFVGGLYADRFVAVNLEAQRVEWSRHVENGWPFQPVVLNSAVVLHDEGPTALQLQSYDGELLDTVDISLDFEVIAAAGNGRPFVYGDSDVIGYRL